MVFLHYLDLRKFIGLVIILCLFIGFSINFSINFSFIESENCGTFVRLSLIARIAGMVCVHYLLYWKLSQILQSRVGSKCFINIYFMNFYCLNCLKQYSYFSLLVSSTNIPWHFVILLSHISFIPSYNHGATVLIPFAV